MKTAEEMLLAKRIHKDSDLITVYKATEIMEEYARLQIEKDREYFINKIAYLEATHPGELVGIRMRYEARPITLT